MDFILPDPSSGQLQVKKEKNPLETLAQVVGGKKEKGNVLVF